MTFYSSQDLIGLHMHVTSLRAYVIGLALDVAMTMAMAIPVPLLLFVVRIRTTNQKKCI